MTTTRTTEITTTARRVARAHNGYLGIGGGKLVFNADGSGGAWYGTESYGFGADMIVVHVGHSKMTAAEAQRLLDDMRLDDMADPESW